MMRNILSKNNWTFILVLVMVVHMQLISRLDASGSEPPCNISFSDEKTKMYLENGHMKVRFNLVYPQIDEVRADIGGEGRFSRNLLSEKEGISLHAEILEDEGSKCDGSSISVSHEGKLLKVYSSAYEKSPQLRYDILSNTTDRVSVQINAISIMNSSLSSIWTLTIERGSRYFTLSTETHVLKTLENVVSVKISHSMLPPSSFGLFETGVVQKMNSTTERNGYYFASNQDIQQYYALGDQLGCLELLFSQSSRVKNVILLSASKLSGNHFISGFQQMIAGSFASRYDQWGFNQYVKNYTQSITILKGTRLLDTMSRIFGNQFDFPASRLPSIRNGIPFEHIRAILTGIYASPVGALVTYQYKMISPTLATPSRAYGELFNFYDPDSWLSISAMLYSGDPYLYEQSRLLLETSMNAMIVETGQLPHHFEVNETTSEITPIYVAISGATQTGPNCFWILAALQYAKNSGNYKWLEGHMPKLRNALDFLLKMYKFKDYHLIQSPGPLFIDVFIRTNFTTDSNAMLVHVLEEMAEAEDFLQNLDKAKSLRVTANHTRNDINAYLWNKQDNDHYITQMNPDGSTRDFVDYDANLLTIALNIAPTERVSSIIKRLNQGECLHGLKSAPRATYVSEKFYDKSNCYLNNTGDSNVMMGRIAWAEAWSRRRILDGDTYTNAILDPLIGELLEKTWLYERYTCHSEPTHNPYYIEYPEVITILLREITYGIRIGLNHIVISPFPGVAPDSFHFEFGDVIVQYSKREVHLHLKAIDGEKTFTIDGLFPNSKYMIQKSTIISNDEAHKKIEKTQVVETDHHGTLRFMSITNRYQAISANMV